MRVFRQTLIVVVLVSLLTSCTQQGTTDSAAVPTTSMTSISTSTSTTVPMPKGTPVVIDSDMAAEGIMSILYLLGRDDIDVQAITVSGTGLVHCESGVEQVLGVLELMEAKDIPVACGPEDPLEGSNTFPTSWRVGADEAHGVDLPEGGQPSDLAAPELLASVIAESPVPVVIYADGPQTNLAEALRLSPTLANNVSMAFIMGGALEVPGNSVRNVDAEWNIWVDPVAADEVFRSGIPITLVPLDATNQVPLHLFHLLALQAHQESHAAEVVVTMLEGNEQLKAGGLYFWDQLTAALIGDGAYGDFRTMKVEVLLDEDRTVAGTTVLSENGAEMRVLDTVDAALFETDFLSALAGTDVGPIVAEPDWIVSFDGSAWSDDLPDSATVGEYIIQLTNDGEGEALVVFGWLTGGATLEDMEAWGGIDQPPFYELESFSWAGPGSEAILLANLVSTEMYVVVGLDVAGDESTVLAAVEVTD